MLGISHVGLATKPMVLKALSLFRGWCAQHEWRSIVRGMDCSLELHGDEHSCSWLQDLAISSLLHGHFPANVAYTVYGRLIPSHRAHPKL